MRIWRLRRRHDHIDAVLRADDGGWELTYLRNNKPLIRSHFASEDVARADAEQRLRELQRAGWITHW